MAEEARHASAEPRTPAYGSAAWLADDAVSDPSAHRRSLTLTAASAITVRRSAWLWQDRIPLGALTLLGGREGLGKSVCAITLVALVTLGKLPGAHYGTPMGVLIVASEDSWAHTIVPRLMAAGADLTRVHRVNADDHDGTGLPVLPSDLDEVGRLARDADAAVLLLDPLASRLDPSLDTHKDAEVRRALEPLVAFADDNRIAVIGVIHVNKTQSTDPLTVLMGSRAFAAVARAVLFMAPDPDDLSIRLLGQPKNNLGRTDLPTLALRIETATVAETEEGPVEAGRLIWLGTSARTIRDSMEANASGVTRHTATDAATRWLAAYLKEQGGSAESADAKRDGAAAGHSEAALGRAVNRSRVVIEDFGFPRRTRWTLPTDSGSAAGGASTLDRATTATTDVTGPTREVPR